MRIRPVTRGMLAVLVLVFPTAAGAQTSAPPSNGWDNAYYQILAESLRRTGAGKWVYTADGHAIGRIADVRTTPDGQHEVAVVRVRRLMGGGAVALPFYRLSRRKDRIVSKDDRAALIAMERLDAPPVGRR
ncbi:PRC-barrel domain containing protein [Methylobacterium sp. P1-11]|uniref:PRC-barrel domain-containing protein n=1 Tax=Methylobacterium sp. P1-11 TaxID=2024616 RepID=UPI0011EF1B8A|nr:PRC-barrel domain-containing protein [Methylobacterium sp. P1-11]KAA0121883.1 PRC-barrel domain containing protein [Methylobacterium sp. P1-11]